MEWNFPSLTATAAIAALALPKPDQCYATI